MIVIDQTEVCFGERHTADSGCPPGSVVEWEACTRLPVWIKTTLNSNPQAHELPSSDCQDLQVNTDSRLSAGRLNNDYVHRWPDMP